MGLERYNTAQDGTASVLPKAAIVSLDPMEQKIAQCVVKSPANPHTTIHLLW